MISTHLNEESPHHDFIFLVQTALKIHEHVCKTDRQQAFFIRTACHHCLKHINIPCGVL